MAPDLKIYVPPFRRSQGSQHAIHRLITPSLPFVSPSLAFNGLPPTVPHQLSLISLQRANRTRYVPTSNPTSNSITKPAKRPQPGLETFSSPPKAPRADIERQLEEEALLGTPRLIFPCRSRIPRDWSTERPGPGPQKRSTVPSYSQLASLHLGLGERVLERDFNPLEELIPRFREAITEVEYAGSYKWIEPDESGRPTLAVPGKHPSFLSSLMRLS